MSNHITIGSLFSGIGGFELGAERAFKHHGLQSKVVFQVERDKYCQSILNKHWPHVPIFNDVCIVGKHNLPKCNILIGGFPCQSISICGKKEGLKNEKKSGLWFEMLRVISELRCPIVVVENVANVLRLGGARIIGDLAKIGYDCEWQIISAAQFGAPHLRKRWFCIATNSDCKNLQKQPVHAWRMETTHGSERRSGQTSWQNKSQYWKERPTVAPLCSVDDGIPNRVARLRALGNAIVPQCSEYIFNHIIRNILIKC